jgi:hypothetical protein
MQSVRFGGNIHFRYAGKSCAARRPVPHSTGRVLDSARRQSEVLASSSRLSDAVLAEKRLMDAKSSEPEWLERSRTARNRVVRAAEDYATSLKVYREGALIEVPISCFEVTR